MSDWDRYTSDQYKILLPEEAYEQENEYVRSFSPPSLPPFLPSLPSLPPSSHVPSNCSVLCATHRPPYLPRLEDEGESELEEDEKEMLALLR